MLKSGRLFPGAIFCLTLFVGPLPAQSSHSSSAVVSKAEAEARRQEQLDEAFWPLPPG